MNSPHRSLSVLQAAQDSPTLARLTELAAASKARLKEIEPLIPAAMRAAVQAGPIEGTSWCLIVANNAVAAKLRQLLPMLESHLRVKGWEVTAIRLKVQAPAPRAGR
jgi:hypothetical protein